MNTEDTLRAEQIIQRFNALKELRVKLYQEHQQWRKEIAPYIQGKTLYEPQ